METQDVQTIHIREIMNRFRFELENELDEILAYWIKYMPDQEFGGFYGKVDHQNRIDNKSVKGLVMHSRILWAFSQASLKSKRDDYRWMADRAYQYLVDRFRDPEYGGYYWSVDYLGMPRDEKKQIYGQAFCIYAMTAYYKATGLPQALQVAKELFYLVEKYSYDTEKGGYFEAFTREWQPIEDLRLSEKDANEKKTMNTHLHVIEAYAALYTVWKEKKLKERMKELLLVFDKYIIDPRTFHLHLFMDEDWKLKSDAFSFGHDIEAAWLLPEAANRLGEPELIELYADQALRVTKAATEGLDKDGGLWHECRPGTGEWTREKHSWPQAEAMVGFFNAYQLSGEDRYLFMSLKSWEFIQKSILDKKGGEWYWGIYEDGSVMESEDKAGFWKCPYHNSRACMELIERIGTVLPVT